MQIPRGGREGGSEGQTEEWRQGIEQWAGPRSEGLGERQRRTWESLISVPEALPSLSVHRWSSRAVCVHVCPGDLSVGGCDELALRSPGKLPSSHRYSRLS